MEQKKYFFAVDLGATSGRTILGTLAEGKFELEELTRFDNRLIETGNHFYWDIFALFYEIIAGSETRGAARHPHRKHRYRYLGMRLRICGQKRGHPPQSSRLPRPSYLRHDGEILRRENAGKEKVYEKTGIQFMNFNSLFQIYAMRKAGNVALENADKILFIPDALSYMLTGNAICEYTVASTSQILNPMTGDLDNDLVESLGLKREQFGKMTNPASIIGTLTEEVQKMTGLNAVPVIAVAGHDTASAVAAVPAKNESLPI